MISKRSQLKQIVLSAAGLMGAFMLAVGLWGLIQQPTSAAGDDSFTGISLADPWEGVRSPVSGGYTATANELTMSVDTASAQTDSTEVLAKAIPDSNAITATLYIDPEWQDKQVRVGLWGEVFSSKDNTVGPGWPIIEFTTIGEDDFTGFRVYDTNGDSVKKWYNLTDYAFNWGDSYTLSIDYRTSSDAYGFYINDTEMLELGASHSDNDNSPRDTFRRIMFATANLGGDDAALNYDATWKDAAHRAYADNVTEVANGSDGSAVTVAAPEGAVFTSVKSVSLQDVERVDTHHDYPLGLLDFTFDTTEQHNLVSLTFVTDLTPDQVIARKYNPATKEYTTIEDATITEATLQGKPALLVQYTITDNGVLDLDPTTGKIADPVGLAVASVPSAPDTGISTAFKASSALPIAAGIVGIGLIVAGVVLHRRINS